MTTIYTDNSEVIATMQSRISMLETTNNDLLKALKDAREVLEETDYRNCLARVSKAIEEAEEKV